MNYAFERDFPTRETARNVYDDQDLQRAVEAYRFFYPTVSVEAIFDGGRSLGLEDGRMAMILDAGPRHAVFTANSDSPYVSGVLDLTRGPAVIELPAGPYVGLIDDHHHRWIADLGVPGPDGGKGGKYLVLPPDHAGQRAGYHVARSSTWKALIALRAIPTKDDRGQAMAALRRVRIHPESAPTAAMEYVDVSSRAFDATPLRWEDNLDFWSRLHGVIDTEPVIDEMKSLYGVLAALGIEKGRRFAPDARMKHILESAAKIGIDQMRVEGFANARPDCVVWGDRNWEWVALVPDDANFERPGFVDLQARERWFVQAICMSPSMVRRKAGGGSLYVLAARDASRGYLDGGKSYKLNVPHPVPASMFWSVTAYDAKTRSQVKTAQDRAVFGSLRDRPVPNADGSVDVFFGPRPPAGSGKESQWIQTVPGEGFFVYFRLYGPEVAALDGSWRLGDLRPALPNESALSITTPDVVPSPIGPLEHVRGMPTSATAARISEHLDYVHAVEAFSNALPLASVYAIRKGMLDIGVQDNDVLLFSELMDCRSLFLTANCDTPYFFSFVDLTRGPMVVEVPPGVLAVIDDMWFRWVTDAGVAGPDRGEGGRYLLVPEGYEGPLPEGGFFVTRVKTNRAFVLGRAFLENDDPRPSVARIRRGLRIGPYIPGGVGSSIASFLDERGPLSSVSMQLGQRFVEGSGREMNTVPPNDYALFEMLHAAIQLERREGFDPEIAGQLAAIGIVNGKPFQPDERTKKALVDAATVANAAARTLAFHPRDSLGFRYYGAESAWMNPLFAGGYEFLAPNTGARLLGARTAFFYVATGITPAMCMELPELGSQYLAAFCDREGRAFEGEATYRLKLPPGIPAHRFWSVTLYDDQTRSMLDTPQRFPRAGSQAYPTPAAEPDAAGATNLVFGPSRPSGVAPGNFVQTTPGRAYFAILRLYGPLDPFFDKSWRAGEIVRSDARAPGH